MNPAVKKYLSSIAKIGGSKTSEAKTKAAIANFKLRWKNHKKKGSE